VQLRFNTPSGIDILQNVGMIFVADTFNHVIRAVSIASADVSTFAGTMGTTGIAHGYGRAATFNAPRDVAVHPAGGFMYVVADSHLIRRINLATQYVSTVAGTGAAALLAVGTSMTWPLEASIRYPTGLCFNANGSTLYYVARNSVGKVDIISTTDPTIVQSLARPAEIVHLAGQYATAAAGPDGTGAAAGFVGPTSCAMKTDGALYVGSSESTVRRITYPEAVVTTAAGAFNSFSFAVGAGTTARFNVPYDLVFSADERDMYILNSGGHCIEKMDMTVGGFNVQLFVSDCVSGLGNVDGVGTAARMFYPRRISLWNTKQVLYTVEVGHVVREITMSGKVTTFAGLYATSGPTWDGVGTAARFGALVGCDIWHRQSMLFVTDDVYTLRSINLFTRQVQTFAGLQGAPGSTNGVGTAARFTYPVAVAIHQAAGVAFVTDANMHAVRRVDLTTARVTTVMGYSSGTSIAAHTDPLKAQLNGAQGACMHPFSQLLFIGAVNSYLYARTDFVLGIPSLSDQATVANFRLLAGSTTTSGFAEGVGSAAQFRDPSSCAYDAGGTMYIAGQDSQTILSVTSTSTVSRFAGTTVVDAYGDGPGLSAYMKGPSGVVIGYGGTDLIVAERWQHVLRKINLLTTYVSVFSGAASSSGNVQGTATASRWYNPFTITYNNMLREYYVVENTPTYRVRKVKLDGSSAFFAGTYNTAGGTDGYYGTGKLADPWHIATVEATSLIFLADGSGHTLRTISALGALETVVGQYTVSGAIDGTGTAVRLDNPRGLAMYHSGRFMFLSENAAAGSARIRRVTWRSGQYVVTTVVGVTAQTTASVPAIQSAWSLCLHPSGTVLAITGSHFVASR
jgi:hypothetical protein